MGQKTGTSNIEKKVITNATQKALVMEYLQRNHIRTENIIFYICIEIKDSQTII